MAFTINQFAVERQKGALTDALNLNTLKVRVDASEAGTLSYAYGVEVVGATEGKLSVKAASSSTASIIGFVNYSLKTDSFVKGDYINISFDNNIMFMEASAAIVAGAMLQYDPTTKKVATKTGSNTEIGVALEKATGDAEIIPVLIKTPAVAVASGTIPGLTATAAELNKLDLSAETETIAAAGAVANNKKITHLALAAAGAVTLAAPDATMEGTVKVIEMTVDNGDVTMALTNVQGGSASATCTWADVGDTLVLVAGKTKWNIASEGGVTLT